jgi:hypothetical protein
MTVYQLHGETINSDILICAKQMCKKSESDMALGEAASCRLHWELRLEAAATPRNLCHLRFHPDQEV